MNVNGIGHGIGVLPRELGPHPKAHPSEADVTAVSTVPPSEDSPDGVEVSSVENNEDSPRGVIRLLLEGHFKGVADVRLRINFQDELADAGFQEAGPVVTEQVASLLEAVGATLRRCSLPQILPRCNRLK